MNGYGLRYALVTLVVAGTAMASCRDIIGLDEFSSAAGGAAGASTAAGTGPGGSGTAGLGGSGGTGGGSPCNSPNACLPDQVETGGECGGCGHEERTCGANCRWGDWECIAGLSTFYHDGDSDTFGDPDDTIEACAPPAGYVVDGTDCDDTRGDVNPMAHEVCANCIDEDCGGADIPCDLTASIAFVPPSPAAYSTVEVTITATPGHACVWLDVDGPGLDVTLDSPATGGGGGAPYTWAWDVDLQGAGQYTFLFSKDNHAPCTVTHEPVICGTLQVN